MEGGGLAVFRILPLYLLEEASYNKRWKRTACTAVHMYIFKHGLLYCLFHGPRYSFIPEDSNKIQQYLSYTQTAV